MCIIVEHYIQFGISYLLHSHLRKFTKFENIFLFTVYPKFGGVQLSIKD